jgi:hypothetical protein
MRRIASSGHGQVARHLLVALRRSSTTRSLVRREEYRAELESRGAEVRLLDIERRTPALRGGVRRLRRGGVRGRRRTGRATRSASAPSTSRGSLKSIEGARLAGIDRFVQVSAINVDNPLRREHRRRLARVRSRPSATPTQRCARATSPGTIIRPGRLTDDPATGLVRRSVRT